MRVTVLFDNLGPYHLARLTAASGICDLSAIELRAASQDYRWRREEGATTFLRRTVFPADQDCHQGIRRSARELTRTIEETKPHVVAIPGWSGWHAFATLQWCVTNHVPAVLMSESTSTDEPRTGWKEWVKRRYVEMCSAALVGGERNRDYLMQLGMPPTKVFFGYDAIDNSYFAEHTRETHRDANAWRQRLSLPENFFLASARFIEKKNLPNLIRAYANYRARIDADNTSNLSPKWDLVILGDGPLRPQLTTLLHGLNLTEHVHLPGFRQYDELPRYYALANAFIHASIEEPWGLVVNEAMASRMPVLVSNRCGCAQTLVKEGENGRTFDPQNIAAMTDCLLAISRSSATALDSMGRRSAEIVAEFGPDRFADGLLQAGNAALATHSKPQRLSDQLLLRSLLLKNARVLKLRSAP